MPRSYNYIYKQLVDGQNDIVGHIAYALYKADKIRFIENFRKNNGDNEPTEQDLEPFHTTSCLEGSLERYKLTAVTILRQFLDYTLEESTKQIEDDCVNSHKQMLEEVIAPIVKELPKPKVQFFWGVGQSVVGAFIFALILAGFGFIALFKANDINFSINTPQGQTKTTVSPKDTTAAKPINEIINNQN